MINLIAYWNKLSLRSAAGNGAAAANGWETWAFIICGTIGDKIEPTVFNNVCIFASEEEEGLTVDVDGVEGKVEAMSDFVIVILG